MHKEVACAVRRRMRRRRSRKSLRASPFRTPGNKRPLCAFVSLCEILFPSFAPLREIFTDDAAAWRFAPAPLHGALMPPDTTTAADAAREPPVLDRKSTRLNSSH